MGYQPFKMAAVGSTPIIKNFGDAKARGFAEAPGKMATFGVDDSDGVDKISTTPNKMATVGSSPAKGWLKNTFNKAKKMAKKVTGSVLGGAKDALGISGGGGDFEAQHAEAHAGDGAGDAQAAAGGAIGGVKNTNKMFGSVTGGMAGFGGVQDPMRDATALGAAGAQQVDPTQQTEEELV